MHMIFFVSNSRDESYALLDKPIQTKDKTMASEGEPSQGNKFLAHGYPKALNPFPPCPIPPLSKIPNEAAKEMAATSDAYH